MKTLESHHCKPTAKHRKLARKNGDESLDQMMPTEFYAGCPDVPGYERAEIGCLMRVRGCVMPHTDNWLGDFGAGPRHQRSFFWMLAGKVHFKQDGAKSTVMYAGDWLVFDHRREHMVLSDNGLWMGAAWQLRPTKA